MKAVHILSILVFYIFLLVVGFVSDAVFPTFESRNGAIVFHGSLCIGVTLMNLSLLFLAVMVVMVLVSVSQKREALLSNELLWRRLCVGLILVFLFAGSLSASLYILSKKILIHEAGIVYYSLLERKELQWSKIERMNGNFVPGSRLGLRGRGNYAWVDFITTNGETVHFSLRFMRGISEFERVIAQKLTEFTH